jgi:molybdopterin converting factor subunit 1
MKNIQVRYYAILREQAGKSEEALATDATSPSALFDELKTRYPFTLSAQQLKVAINAEFRDWHTPLNDGDSVVFIPPVAGG